VVEVLDVLGLAAAVASAVDPRPGRGVKRDESHRQTQGPRCQEDRCEQGCPSTMQEQHGKGLEQATEEDQDDCGSNSRSVRLHVLCRAEEPLVERERKPG
jgi:hypothetical protein